ncbi:MAG: T9SS type A sorting domain-containing protein [Bacteroidetes bacterium]|nr:T9SS type A sorting domain-containing protein [Bacteroidota bacterium]
MKNYFFSAFFLFVVSSKICIAQVEPFGLQGQTITSFSAVPRDYNFGELIICAGTNGNGVFSKKFDLPDTNWICLGLRGRIITSLTVQHRETGPAGFNTIFAGVQPDYISGDSTVLFERDFFSGFDTTWKHIDSGLILNQSSIAQSLKSFHYHAHAPLLPIILLYSFDVYKLYPFLTEWQLILSNNEWNVLAISQNHWPEVIWVGGETANTELVFAKSLNFGSSWEFFLPGGYQSNCTAIEIDPIDNDIVYVALGGELIKTTNGGEEWFPTELQNQTATFTSIIINPTNSKHLLVGGTTGENNFILYESDNGGSNWHEIQPISSLPGISSMIADISNNEFSVYIGTLGNGVFLYKTQITFIDEETNELIPDQFRLYQNYPNPFNPSTRIKYALSSRQFVSLKVYDVLGNEIATLVNEEKPAGSYEVEFSAIGGSSGGDAFSLPSGVYFYQIKAGSFIQTKKIVLLR